MLRKVNCPVRPVIGKENKSFAFVALAGPLKEGGIEARDSCDMVGFVCTVRKLVHSVRLLKARR